eukprot:TRINITY_DN4801_c0_g1_i1.p1 TRINITY_DN4801_c0_g1~~TRINITY_DN4801_c0_g1_i1.p1  ORF type:complete len:246 (+),score=34.36 TRINITY_DN4801_c0_g1_i1:367-1104(+)
MCPLIQRGQRTTPGAAQQDARPVYLGLSSTQSMLALHSAIANMEPVIIEVADYPTPSSSDDSTDASDRREECLERGVEMATVTSFDDINVFLSGALIAVELRAPGAHDNQQPPARFTCETLTVPNDALCGERKLVEKIYDACCVCSSLRVLTGAEITIFSTASPWLRAEPLLLRMASVGHLLKDRRPNGSCAPPWAADDGGSSSCAPSCAPSASSNISPPPGSTVSSSSCFSSGNASPGRREDVR